MHIYSYRHILLETESGAKMCARARVYFRGEDGGTQSMLLGALARHPCRSTAGHILKSISCGRRATVDYHLFLFR